MKLMEEATDEEERKGWCDTELGTNQQTRDTKSEEAEKLKSESDMLTANIAKMSDDIADLAEGIAEVDKAVADATADREAEKAKNAVTIADATQAGEATTKALAVLQEYYAKAATSTAFVQ